MSLRKYSTALTVLVLAGLVSASPVRAQVTLYAIANGGTTLISFQSNNPGGAALVGNFSGGNTFLDAISFSPVDGQLYGFKSNFGSPGTTVDTLYKVNPITAALTIVGTSGTTTNTNFLGTGFDPATGFLHVVTNSTQNIVLNPTTGAVQTIATGLSYAAGDVNANANPLIIANAYSNNLAGHIGQEYGIDYGTGTLDKIAGNAGTLTTVGSLGVATDLFTGLSIFTSKTGVDSAYALLGPASGAQETLYNVNLATGAATSVGSINGFTQVYSLAAVLASTPEPGTVALFVGLAGNGLFVLRQKKRKKK